MYSYFNFQYGDRTSEVYGNILYTTLPRDFDSFIVDVENAIRGTAQALINENQLNISANDFELFAGVERQLEMFGYQIVNPAIIANVTDLRDIGDDSTTDALKLELKTTNSINSLILLQLFDGIEELPITTYLLDFGNTTSNMLENVMQNFVNQLNFNCRSGVLQNANDYMNDLVQQLNDLLVKEVLMSNYFFQCSHKLSPSLHTILGNELYGRLGGNISLIDDELPF